MVSKNNSHPQRGSMARTNLDALLLLHRSMDGHRWEVALLQKLVELDGALHRLDEDYHLIELEGIESANPVSIKIAKAAQ